MVKRSVGKVIGDDGVGLDFVWSGSSLGVKRSDEAGNRFQFVDLKGSKGDKGDAGNSVRFSLNDTGTSIDLWYVDSNGDRISEVYSYNAVGRQGDKGEKGDKGDAGDPATAIQLENFISFFIDDESGDLCVYYDDSLVDYSFELDEESGDLYIVYSEDSKVNLGHVKGEVGDIEDGWSDRIIELENDYTLIQTQVLGLIAKDYDSQIASLNNKINTLTSRIDELESEEAKQNNLLGVE